MQASDEHRHPRRAEVARAALEDDGRAAEFEREADAVQERRHNAKYVTDKVKRFLVIRERVVPNAEGTEHAELRTQQSAQRRRAAARLAEHVDVGRGHARPEGEHAPEELQRTRDPRD